MVEFRWASWWCGGRGRSVRPGEREVADGGCTAGLSGAAVSGQDPGSVLVGQAQGDQSSHVECRGTVVQPLVVLLDASVGDAAAAADQPGDRSFDHGPLGAVAVPEGRVGGALTMLSLQEVVRV